MTFVAGTILTAAALNSELAAKTDLAMVKNAQTGVSYSYALADQTKLLTMSNSSANTVLVTKQATVAWAADTQLRVLNLGAGVTTLVADTGVTINNNTALAQWRGGVLIRMSSDVWTFVPFASGVGAANFSDAATGTYTGYKYITFSSGSSTLTVTTPGFADIVLLAGGAGGGYYAGGGGGAGGLYGGASSTVYLEAGTYTVVVGAGGAGGASTDDFGRTGSGSRLGNFVAAGGGSGASVARFPGGGGSGGGSGINTAPGGIAMPTQGSAGGVGSVTNYYGGGGGGVSAVGSPGAGTVAGNGGAGVNVTIAGTTPTGAYVAGNYGLGGGGGGGGTAGTAGTATFGGGNGATGAGVGTAGTANKGGGGGGGGNATVGGNGGSGIVIVRVAV